MAKLKIHPAALLMPEMSTEDYDALKEDIRVNGQLDPITLLDDMILDGRNRYRVCGELGIEPKTTTNGFSGSPLVFVISMNLNRRHLTVSQKAAIAAELKPMLEKEARDRQKEAGRAAGVHGSKGGRGNKKPLGEKIPQGVSQGLDRSNDSRQQAADIVGINERYVNHAVTLKKEAPKLFKQVKAGVLTISQAIRAKKKTEITTKLESIEVKEAKAIEGVYDVIVIDPPWPMEKIERDVRPNQAAFDYPTMSEDDIRNIKIPTASDCHVWLWTTHRFLPLAIRLLDSWQLKYVCTFVWKKPGGFQPIGLPQYNCEFAIYARRGSPAFIDTKAFNTCFDAPRGKHSEKPEEFYDVVRRVTAGRRLDMFNRRSIEGFDGWGKEAAGGRVEE